MPNHCIEHVWRLTAVDFTDRGSILEQSCTRCGQERTITQDQHDQEIIDTDVVTEPNRQL